MARLRKPSSAETPVFIASTPATRTRPSSPRKAVPESPSTRELRYTSSQDPEDAFLVPKIPTSTSPVRKQRVLRPVASNSRLLRKLSDESLYGTPDRKERRGLDVGAQKNYLYSKTLAKSVARKQAGSRKIGGGVEVESVFDAQIVVDEEEIEKSIICGDGVGVSDEGEKENREDVEDDEDEDDDDEPVVASRQRRRQPQARRVVSDTEEEESEEDEYCTSSQGKGSTLEVVPEATIAMPPPSSKRPSHLKGHSTISHWAQEVVDLTSSPEPPSSFEAQLSTRVRTASFAASSRPTSSASHDVDAMLHFSPTPTKFRSPRKAPPVSRPSTPPAPISPSKLVSPSKKNPRIPHAAALRPSVDAFWNPEVVNDWNDRHSPSKPLLSPRKQNLFKQLESQMNAITITDSEDDAPFPSPTTSPRKKKAQQSPTKKKQPDSSSPTVADLRAQRKDFAARKHAMAEAFVTELDTTITGGQIAHLSAPTGGIKLIWSKTLKTTAGRANWRREAIRTRIGSDPAAIQTTYRHHCSIELAEKVIDDPDRLYNVLAHEYCHLTTFMISEVRNNPHGAEFKSWGAKVTRAFAHVNVEVTTKHSYKIEYKYIWECVVCGYEFKRHSKSVDPVRHSCGRCKGKLVQTKPVPRAVKQGKPGEKTSGGAYQAFVKENFARVKREMLERGEDVQMGKVMEVVAREYRARRDEGGVAKGMEVRVDEVESALEALTL